MSKNIEKKIRTTNQFIRKHNLSSFDKQSLKALVGVILINKGIYNEDFYKYLKENKETFDKIIAKLDPESRNLIKRIKKEINYFATNSLGDIMLNFFADEKKVLDFIKTADSCRQFKLNVDFYDQSVFNFKHGLVYIPEERIKSINNIKIFLIVELILEIQP